MQTAGRPLHASRGWLNVPLVAFGPTHHLHSGGFRLGPASPRTCVQDADAPHAGPLTRQRAHPSARSPRVPGCCAITDRPRQSAHVRSRVHGVLALR